MATSGSLFTRNENGEDSEIFHGPRHGFHSQLGRGSGSQKNGNPGKS